MKGIGRILGTIGWLMVIAGIGGPIFGLDGFNIFPGIALLFIGRLLSRQGKRSEAEAEPDSEREPASERLLNTERQTARRPPRRQPPERRQAPPPPPPPVRPVAPEEVETSDRESMLETILLAGTELAEEKEIEDSGDDMGDTDSYEPMTSEEMIARARQRWDRKPMRPGPDMTERS
ncbi:MAG: hypothetical protein PVG83_03200 [Acidimicrobiia bacterium]|jgi:hypothetical protein